MIAGSKEKISGINAFLQSNHLAADVGNDVLIRWPTVTVPLPESVSNFSAAYVLEGPGDNAKIVLNWEHRSSATADQFVRIWMRNQQKLFHKQFVDFAPVLNNGAEIRYVRGPEGVELRVSFFRTSSAYIQLDVVDRSTGWASIASAMILLKLIPV